jgi:holo-[acyl-carrier protein] synthase
MSAPNPLMVVGCDVVEVARIRRLLVERPEARGRIFTSAERSDAIRGGVDPDGSVAIERLAARFAAKEATRKALGGRGPGLTAIEVRSTDAGAPTVWIDGRPTTLACSLSHDAGVAMAVVVGTRDDVAAVLDPDPDLDVDRDVDRDA